MHVERLLPKSYGTEVDMERIATEAPSSGCSSSASSEAGWREPATHGVYPFAFEAYRARREREERWPARHQRLGTQVDREQWRRWVGGVPLVVEFEVQPTAPPRIQRVIGEILRAIRHGASANEAIRAASRRLRVRPGRVRAWIAAHVTCLRVPVSMT